MCAASRLCRRGLAWVGLVELLEECIHLGLLHLHLKLKVFCHFRHLVLEVLVAGGELLLEVLDVIMHFFIAACDCLFEVIEILLELMDVGLDGLH